MTTYEEAGVNIELGDDVSKILYNAAKQTWDNRKGKLGEIIVPFDDFSGVRAIDVSNLPSGTLMNIGFDGVGTKMELAERVGDHRTIAYDLFAMVCDDAVVRGAEPVLIGSILDVNTLTDNIEEVRQLAEGYVNAARDANVAVINGEVAELGNRVGGYGKFNYNWGAGLVWFANKDRLFTGLEIKDGDSIVALKENGFRSNGLSLVRKILNNNDWPSDLVQAALEPSKIYSGAVVDMFGGYDGEPKAEIHGVVHVTGGGIPGKLGRVLKPSGLGANLDNLYTPPDVMLECQKLGDVSNEEAYKTWNMGQGMLIISPNPADVISVASGHGIDAKEVGEVYSKPSVCIKSKGYCDEGLLG